MFPSGVPLFIICICVVQPLPGWPTPPGVRQLWSEMPFCAGDSVALTEMERRPFSFWRFVNSVHRWKDLRCRVTPAAGVLNNVLFRIITPLDWGTSFGTFHWSRTLKIQSSNAVFSSGSWMQVKVLLLFLFFFPPSAGVTHLQEVRFFQSSASKQTFERMRKRTATLHTQVHGGSSGQSWISVQRAGEADNV